MAGFDDGGAMSVLDDVRRFERHLVERLTELEPLVREYDQLRAVARQMGISYTPGERTAPADAPRARADSPPKGRPGRAGARAGGGAAAAKPAKPPTSRGRPRSTARPTRRGQAVEQVMRVVGEEPGITVRGISERLKVNRPDLYRLTVSLAKQGRLRTDGPKLYVPDTPTAAPQSKAPADERRESSAAAPSEAPGEAAGRDSAADPA